MQSHRDLPILINQWANVMRWELRPRLFLRTTEFLWQEGHTVHANEPRRRRRRRSRCSTSTSEMARDWLAIPVRKGHQIEVSRPSPARCAPTRSKGMMQDGKALQMGTSHNLGQNFAKAFEIQFQDTDGERKLAWTTSWGVSTRLIGAIVMAHGDDKGLVLPPRIAPIQVVLVPIFRKDDEKAAVLEAANNVIDSLKARGIRARLDDRDQLKPGPKFFEWEKKGVPIRLELGPRDLADGKVVAVRRDIGDKTPLAMDGLDAVLAEQLEAMQADMLKRGEERLESMTHEASSMEEFEKLLDGPGGFVLAHWDGTDDTERAIKDKTKATIRVLGDECEGTCVLTGKPATRRAYFARSY